MSEVQEKKYRVFFIIWQEENVLQVLMRIVIYDPFWGMRGVLLLWFYFQKCFSLSSFSPENSLLPPENSIIYGYLFLNT